VFTILPPPPGQRFVAVEPDRHRPLVDQRDPHRSAETPRLDTHPLATQQLNKVGAQSLGPRGFARFAETRATPLAAVRIERELRDHQQIRLFLQGGTVEMTCPVRVGKQAQVHDFLGHGFQNGRVVAIRDPDQQQIPASNGADDPTVHLHRRLRNPLNHNPHKKILFPGLNRYRSAPQTGKPDPPLANLTQFLRRFQVSAVHLDDGLGIVYALSLASCRDSSCPARLLDPPGAFPARA
jgi:hypothetical protein